MKTTKSNKGYRGELIVLAAMNEISTLRTTRMDAPNCEYDLVIVNTTKTAEAIAKDPDALIKVGVGLWDVKTAPFYSQPTDAQKALGVRICVVSPPPDIKIKWR